MKKKALYYTINHVQKYAVKPTGVMIILAFEDKFLLVQRDYNVQTRNPGTWAPVTGGVDEEDEGDIEKTAKKELKQELDLIPNNLLTLGISEKGVGFFFARLSKEDIHDINLGDEGQRFYCFTLDKLTNIKLGGTFPIYLEKYRDIFEKIAKEKYQPTGADFELKEWKKANQELKKEFELH